ncbi:MAG TPA: hypothetical protein PLG43_11370 [Spirochaetia bacterium]|nr:hypothetical protein [Spirochaetia bacterium]
MKRKILIIASVITAFIILAIAVYFLSSPQSTTLEFTVRDAVSLSWVWDMEASIQNTIINGYFQSDRGPVPFVFRDLKPGSGILSITAPFYQPIDIPVDLRRGKNIITEPIDLRGLYIDDLSAFYVFEEKGRDGFSFTFRPVSSKGMAIQYHPCIDIWVGLMVSEQIRNGTYVTEPVDEGSERGTVLYKGELPWYWDSVPETQFRYKATLAGKLISPSPAPYLVFDYLIIVPKPGFSIEKDVKPVIEHAWKMDSIEKILSFLNSRTETFSFYYDTSWNIGGSR